MDTYEKKYKDALERASKYNFDGAKQVVKDLVTYIFPELKESEDEMIRKELIEYFRWNVQQILNDFDNKKVLAWLEKQGEQNVADKIKPKFHEGDWVVCGKLVTQITSIENDGYTNSDQGFISFETAKKFHLWTIQDAKDGDVLLFEGNYNSIVLFQGIGINGKGRINYHCKCDLGNYSFGIQGDVACLGTVAKDAEHYHPATKEQRDLLFQKMKEAGYEWDSEKWELKKISQRMISAEAKEAMLHDKYEGLTDFERTLANICIGWIGEEIGWKQYIKDNANALLKIAIKMFNSVQDAPFEQKPTDNDMVEALRTEYEKGRADAFAEMQKEWSEDDEKRLQSCINILKAKSLMGKVDTANTMWLKSLKQRMGGKL